MNKEFDVILSLLPDDLLTEYFSLHFSIPADCQWSIIGSSNDFEQSSGISFMYMDTLAYCHKNSTLVAIELKMDSELGNEQLLKYQFMAAHLEAKGMINQNSSFKILVISPDSKVSYKLPSLVETAKNQLENKYYPKKRTSIEAMEALAPRVKEFLKNTQIEHTTWQAFGDHFERLLQTIPDEGYPQALHKLIFGFLSTLKTKYSRELESCIFSTSI